MLDKINFLSLNCIRLANESLELLVTQSIGPRILSLRFQGGDNLLAELPDMQLDCPGEGELNLWGGHRLWHAPEVQRRTYLPDNDPVSIEPLANGLRVVQPVDKTGLQKAMTITLPDSSATVIIDHELRNHNYWSVTCAPWAITQLRPGGTAILPQPTQPSDPDGLQPNRSLVLWPYTDVNSPHIRWGNAFVLVKADMTEGALKVGWANPAGYLAYQLNQTLFIKKADFDPAAFYYDRGASSQVYCHPRFIELETLGARVEVAPGRATTHREIWQIHPCDTPVTDEKSAKKAMFNLARGSTFAKGGTSPTN